MQCRICNKEVPEQFYCNLCYKIAVNMDEFLKSPEARFWLAQKLELAMKQANTRKDNGTNREST